MPLVYGVCRTASAPTLSHGGSRLNASKPEANPKTRCPQTTPTRGGLPPRRECEAEYVTCVEGRVCACARARWNGEHQHTVTQNVESNRHPSHAPVHPGLAHGTKSTKCSQEVAHHGVLSRVLRDLPFSLRGSVFLTGVRGGGGNAFGAVVRGCLTDTVFMYSTLSAKVPLQTREHAWAGISDVPRRFAGARGALTSRGAEP